MRLAFTFQPAPSIADTRSALGGGQFLLVNARHMKNAPGHKSDVSLSVAAISAFARFAALNLQQDHVISDAHGDHQACLR